MIYTDGVHMVADSLIELHEFACKIGLHPLWFQDHPKHPHYNIWGMKLVLAKKFGTKTISTRELLIKSKALT